MYSTIKTVKMCSSVFDECIRDRFRLVFPLPPFAPTSMPLLRHCLFTDINSVDDVGKMNAKIFSESNLECSVLDPLLFYILYRNSLR